MIQHPCIIYILLGLLVLVPDHNSYRACFLSLLCLTSSSSCPSPFRPPAVRWRSCPSSSRAYGGLGWNLLQELTGAEVGLIFFRSLLGPSLGLILSFFKGLLRAREEWILSASTAYN